MLEFEFEFVFTANQQLTNLLNISMLASPPLAY